MKIHGKLMIVMAMVGLSGVWALGQFTVPDPPPHPAVAQPAGAAQPENLGSMELRIGLQKAQIQAALADKVAQIREGAFTTAQAGVQAGKIPPEDVLAAQADALVARAGADSAKLDVASLDLQVRAGPAALQQAQMAQQQQGLGAVPNPLILQLMENDLKKVHLQTVLADQMLNVRQQQFTILSGKARAAGGDDRTTDAQVDLEAAKAAQQSAALDEQLMTARYVAAGGKR